MNIQGAQIFRNIFGKEAVEEENGVDKKQSGNLFASKAGTGKIDGFNIQAEWMEFFDPTTGMSEEQQAAFEERITQKLRSGKKLSAEEMNYLQVKNPQMYVQAARVQTMRENLKSQLENCKSKEEVEKIYGDAVSMIGKEDPMREAIMAAYDDVAKEFKKTEEYQALPEKEEDIEA